MDYMKHLIVLEFSMNPFRSQINKSNQSYKKHKQHEVGQISDEAQSRDSHHRVEEWNPGENIIANNIRWDFLGRASSYNPATNKCRLCLLEKFFILYHPDKSALNRRSELFSKCLHKRKNLLYINTEWKCKILSSYAYPTFLSVIVIIYKLYSYVINCPVMWFLWEVTGRGEPVTKLFSQEK